MKLDIKTIKKYEKKSTASLIKICVRWCHKYIRKRDEGLACISCGQYRTLEAGHCFSGGKYPRLRFYEWNINGQCKQCNYYGSMETGITYRDTLIQRIGKEEFEKIQRISEDRTPFKWDRFDLITKIEHYKTKYNEK